jgi:carbamoyl-phosphate synthase large subunit
MRILFTGGGGAGNEALWRILNKKYTLFFADANPDNIDKTIPKHFRKKVDMANSENYLKSVNIICKENKIDLIVPGVDEELIQFNSYSDIGSSEILLPHKNFITLMLNKFSSANAIKSYGLTAPKTYRVDRANEIGFPLIVKPVTGRGSRGVHVVNSQKELDAYKVLYATNEKNIIIQELGIGIEYTVLVSANKGGYLNAIIPVRVYSKKGITIQAKIDMNDLIIEYAKKFHFHFKTSGIYNIQCILTKSGVVYPFEVNPRISTTFCLSIAAGFDPFEIYFKKNQEKNLFYPDKSLNFQRSWFNNFY